MEPGNPWGAGCHMAAASRQVPTIDLLASGLHPMETWRHIASVLDSLSVCFWGLGEEASSVTTGLFVTDEA